MNSVDVLTVVVAAATGAFGGAGLAEWLDRRRGRRGEDVDKSADKRPAVLDVDVVERIDETSRDWASRRGTPEASRFARGYLLDLASFLDESRRGDT